VSALSDMLTGLGTVFVSRNWPAVSFLTGCEITVTGRSQTGSVVSFTGNGCSSRKRYLRLSPLLPVSLLKPAGNRG